MFLSASEIKRLLCPNPYECGPESKAVPPELLKIEPYMKIMEEAYQGTAVLSRCSGCDKLAVRRLNIVHPKYKVVLDIKGIFEVPGVDVLPDKKNRRNLYADAFIYADQCLGVKSSDDLCQVGDETLTEEDVKRTFPIEETENEEEAKTDPTSSNANGAMVKKCAQCGTVKDGLFKCKGACCGVVAYCNRDCQIKHWKQGHKKVCGKIATSNTFSIPNDESVLPLRALHSLDGFGKSALSLYYSNHLGDAVSIPIAEQLLGGFDPQDFEGTMHCFMTSPIYDEVERALLKPGEACFNISKNPTEFNELVKHKIVTPTDKTLQIGYYPTRHPVCRINLPLYKPKESG